MTKPIVKVFPDYCSTGVWLPDGCNAEPDELGISPSLQLALKYWHEVWEFNIADIGDDRFNPRTSERYVNRWIDDGKKLAELMTVENDKYVFVYMDQ